MGFPVIHVPFLKPNGMALFPFILIRVEGYKNDKQLINHEKIHLWQQLELLVVPFYILYILNYALNLLRYKNHDDAYRNILFEREAYANDADLDYLKNRKIFSWLRFL